MICIDQFIASSIPFLKHHTKHLKFSSLRFCRPCTLLQQFVGILQKMHGLLFQKLVCANWYTFACLMILFLHQLFLHPKMIDSYLSWLREQKDNRMENCRVQLKDRIVHLWKARFLLLKNAYLSTLGFHMRPGSSAYNKPLINV